MAIKRPATSASNPEELVLSVTNGDLEALRNAMNRLGFLDEESVLRYALAVLSKSATRSLTITDKDGARVNLNPSADLLRPLESTTQS